MMLGYTMGQNIMLQLGSFQFSVNTAAYQDLRRSTQYKWATQDRFGQAPARQFTGYGDDSITLQGVIYPEYRGGLGQLDQMRAIARSGQPQLLVDGNGRIMGRWVIEQVDEGQTVFAINGQARKQEFTLQIKRREA